MLKKKVSFYKLSIHTNHTTEDHLTMVNEYLTNNQIENVFLRKYENMLVTSTGTHVITLANEATHNTYVFEIISVEDHIAFLRIGRNNDSNTCGIRDMSSLEIDSVPLGQNQHLETYTYCIIDFSICVVAFIEVIGAPTFNSLSTLLGALDENNNSIATLSAILNDDIISKLNQKKVISKISINVAVPNDQVLAQRIGLSMDDFDSLENVKTRTATFKIVGPKNRNIFGSSGKLSDFLSKLQSKFGAYLRGVHVNARDEGEKMQSFNLLNSLLTQTTYIGDDDGTANYTMENFKEALIRAYSQNKPYIIRYIREERGD